jgi:hypothetical protein
MCSLARSIEVVADTIIYKQGIDTALDGQQHSDEMWPLPSAIFVTVLESELGQKKLCVETFILIDCN